MYIIEKLIEEMNNTFKSDADAEIIADELETITRPFTELKPEYIQDTTQILHDAIYGNDRLDNSLDDISRYASACKSYGFMCGLVSAYQSMKK